MEFYNGSTKVLYGLYKGSVRVLQGFCRDSTRALYGVLQRFCMGSAKVL